jgi:menaquinone-dependent protoporphyrinogen oxidase
MNTKNVLVAYASKYGASAEIATKIQETLLSKGIQTQVVDVATYQLNEKFDAVVIGSAVYAGNWLPHAAAFLINNTEKLREKPVWIFSSGPTGEGNAVEQMKGWLYPAGLKSAIEEIAPKDIKLFHGDLNMKKLNFFEKLIIKLMKAPQGDFRNWQEIEQWALSIAEELKK